MDYNKLNKDELIAELQSKDRFIEHYQEEKAQELDLTFAWTGNLGHWYWDVKGNKVTFNKLKATTLGYSDEEVPENVGFEWFTEKLHPEDYEYVMQNMRDHLYGKSEAYEVEYRIKTKNGSWKWYHDRGTVTKRSNQGEPLFLAGIVFDITTKKEIELKHQNLIKMLSDQMKSQENIYSVIFHDLANALNGVIGFARILKEEAGEKCDSQVKRFVDILHQSATNSINITKTLLNWKKAKRDLGNDKESIDLNDVVREVLEEFDFTIKEKKLTGSIKIPADTKVIANKSVLRIALRNFISNAIKYSNISGNLDIKYKDNKICICDNGVGMSADTLKNLFKSSITPAKGTSDEKGHGLGLMLVKELLDQSEIEVEIISELGEGTNVNLIIK